MARQPTPSISSLIEKAYDAFNRRDIEGAVQAMTSDVVWSNGWEGGYVHGHDGVRDYWTRQWREIDPTVVPTEISMDDDGRVVVEVSQEVRTPDGTLVGAGTVQHVYTLRDDLIARMDIAQS